MTEKTPKDAPVESDQNPFGLGLDDSKDPKATSKTEDAPVEKTEEPKPKSKTTSKDAPKAKRRTKAEIEAEAIEDAKTLLKDSGYVVSNVSSPDEADEGTFVPTHLPVNAHSGDVVGSLKTNSAGVAVLTLSVKRWVGEPPMVLQAAQIDDVLAVLSNLRARSLSEEA